MRFYIKNDGATRPFGHRRVCKDVDGRLTRLPSVQPRASKTITIAGVTISPLCQYVQGPDPFGLTVQEAYITIDEETFNGTHLVRAAPWNSGPQCAWVDEYDHFYDIGGTLSDPQPGILALENWNVARGSCGGSPDADETASEVVISIGVDTADPAAPAITVGITIEGVNMPSGTQLPKLYLFHATQAIPGICDPYATSMTLTNDLVVGGDWPTTIIGTGGTVTVPI